jgi:hypothetical protein
MTAIKGVTYAARSTDKPALDTIPTQLADEARRKGRRSTNSSSRSERATAPERR